MGRSEHFFDIACRPGSNVTDFNKPRNMREAVRLLSVCTYHRTFSSALVMAWGCADSWLLRPFLAQGSRWALSRTAVDRYAGALPARERV